MAKSTKILVFVALVALGLLVYSNALSGPFVLDDTPYIAGNEWIRSLPNFLDVSGLRYIGDLSYALNYRLGGLDPFGYHLVNVLIHIFNSILLFSFLTAVMRAVSVRGTDAGRASPGLAIAFSVSVIFLVHPVQIQAVTYISQRYTSLAALFYLSSMVLYLKARLPGADGLRSAGRRGLYLGALVSALLAMKTKEISFTLPFVMALLEFTLFSDQRRFRQRIAYLAPFFLVALVIPLGLVLPSMGVLKSGNRMEELMRMQKLKEVASMSSYRYLITQAGVVTTYIRLVLFPAHRYFNYHFPLAKSVLEPAVYVPAAALAALFASAVLLLIRAVRRNAFYGLLAAIGILWFFMTLSVESSVIPIKETFAERRLYLPSAGLILSLVTGVFYLGEWLKNRWNAGLDAVKLTVILLLVAALPLAAVTHSRNAFWNDEVLLYEEWVRKYPQVSFTHMYLALEYFRRGRPDDALVEFKKAASIDPGSVVIHKNLAKYYFRVGLMEKSIAENRLVLDLDPGNTEARYSLGVLYMSKGMLNEARAELEAVLRENADYPMAGAAIEHIDKLEAEGSAPGH